MKRNILLNVLLVSIILCFTLGLAGCEHKHNMIYYAEKNATCTLPGNVEYWHCADCGKDFADEQGTAELVTITVEPHHDLTRYEAKEATCLESGWGLYEACKRCNYTTKVEIVAKGHNLTNYPAQNVTCVQNGWNAYQECSNCDYTTKVEVKAIGHILTSHPAKSATCTEIGWDAYETCERCDYTTYKEISALGHNLTSTPAKSATCTEIGWDAYETCDRCDYTTYKKISALGHKEEIIPAVPATTTTAGLTEGKKCSICQTILVAQKSYQLSDFGYANYDYTYLNSVTEPAESTSPAGMLDLLIYLFADDFTKPSLNGDFYSALVEYETRYNNLSVADKALVKNYAFLQEARKAYNDMAKQECKRLISILPDATIDNLTEFTTFANAIEKLLVNLGNEANLVPNKNIYDQKVAKADSLLIETFNQKVTALQQFEYTKEYKAKLDDASTIYSLMNASQQSRVAQSYATLTALKTKYDNVAVAYSFVDTVNSLPDVNSLKDTDQAIIKQLKKVYNKMTDAQKAEVPVETKTKYNAYIAKAQELWPEHILQTYSETKYGDDFFKFNSRFPSAQRPEAPVIYEGVKQENCLKIDAGRKVTFTTQKAGVLTIYANIRDRVDNKCDLVLKLNGVEVARQTVKHDASGEYCEYVFNCTTAGTYELSFESSGEGGLLYYLIFS